MTVNTIANSKALSIVSAIALILWGAFGFFKGLLGGPDAIAAILGGFGVLGIHPSLPPTPPTS